MPLVVYDLPTAPMKELLERDDSPDMGCIGHSGELMADSTGAAGSSATVAEAQYFGALGQHGLTRGARTTSPSSGGSILGHIARRGRKKGR